MAPVQSLDGAAQEILKPETFEVHIRILQFVQALMCCCRANSMSRSLLLPSPRNLLPSPSMSLDVRSPLYSLTTVPQTRDTAFDAKPFIQSFEAAVDRLISIRKDVQDRTERMEKSVRVAEREYSKKMAELNRGFDVRALRHSFGFH